MNIRVGIVITLIILSALILQQLISRTLYSNMIGYLPQESLNKSIEFTSHPKFDMLIENMPEELGQLFTAYRSQTILNNDSATTYLSYRRLLIFGILVVLIPLILTISVVITRRITAPIRNLISATKQLTQGDFKTRANPNKLYWDNYSLALADDFNTMATSLESLEKERQTMIADIAHELRTPITTMQLRLEAVQDGIDPLDQTLINSLHAETELLSRLIIDLRTLSLAEAKQLSLNQQTFNLYNLIENTATRFRALAQKKNITISIHGIKNTHIYADPERINQILNNLMSNAIRHTPTNGKVTIEFELSLDGATLKVINTGSALPQAELNQIFNRFYRSGKGRVRAEGGSGLGLAIVKALAELHEGTVGVENHGADSIMFYLVLPQNYSDTVSENIYNKQMS